MKRITLLVCGALLCAAIAAPTASAAPPAPSSPALTVPISGSATNDLGQTVNFVGTYTLQRFTTQGGELAAVGTVTGTATNTATGATETITQSVTLPVIDTMATCQILHLELGPLDLDLLGLVVHLDRVVLDITAESGPGNLLGNLLCGIAGLLDSNATTGGLARILNQIIAILD
jgi:hypothetical protein